MQLTAKPTNNLVLNYLAGATEKMARLYVFTMLNVYGFAKIAKGQFYRQGDLPAEVANKTIDQLNGFETAWTFFGYSAGYIWFIGLSQIIGAFLLLHTRTKLLGAFILIPILLNIIVMDYFYQVSHGAMMSAILYFCLLLWVMYHNRASLISALRQITQPSASGPQSLWPALSYFSLVAVLAVVVFLLDVFVIRHLGL